MPPPEDDRPPSAGKAAEPLEDAPTAGLLQPASEDRSPRVRSGLVLAERYRVLRFLAQGGMGEIYEVEDLQLGERVALKTIRAGHARDPHALERFKREIQLARRVTHKNVCRIFEFGVHRDRDGSTIAFLTMELLPGETLLEKLRRDGRMTPAQALPIVLQLTAALEAAHRAGVVHRDFKSANVVLVPSLDGEPRAVITDFGLAQLASLGGRRPQADEVSGTLDYMAPEQIAGVEATPSVDIYALGVVVYEMVAGARPFGSGPQSALAKLRRPDEPVRSPRAHVPDLEPAWEAAILRCLAIEPERRFHDASEVARALAGEPSRRGRRAALAAAVAGLLLPTLWLGYRAWVSDRNAVAARRSVAVLPFKNLSGRAEATWLSTALSEMMTTELGVGQRLRTIPGEQVARMRVELQLPEADALARDTLARVRGNLGSDLVVLGAYLASPSELRVDVRVQDARQGETVAAFTETARAEEVLPLMARAGGRLRRTLGLAELSPTQIGELRASLPANPRAARYYSDGLARLRTFDALQARDLLREAVAADPDFPLAHAALSAALARLGFEEGARDEARQAFERSQGLPREEKLLVEAHYREMAHDRAKAAEIYRVLFGFFPDNFEYGLGLAQALNLAGRTRESLETLAELRRLPAPAATDPRIDVAEAEVSEAVGDFAREREAARRAARRANETGARLIVARARVLEAYASSRLGRVDDARVAAAEAKSLYLSAGDRAGVGWALNRAGTALYQQGRLKEALQTYQDALGLFDQIGYRGGLASLLNNINEAQVLQGDLAAARRSLLQARSSALELREPRRGIIVALNLTNLDAEAGEFETADNGYREAIQACEQQGEESLKASAQRHWADSLASRGELAEATKLYLEALATHRRLDNPRYVAYTLLGLGRIQREQDRATEARSSQEEALRVRTRLDDRVGIAESRLAIAELDLDEGRARPAEDQLRQALPPLHAEDAHDAQALANGLLAQALADQGRSAEALRAIDDANALAGRSERAVVRLALRIVEVRAGSRAPGSLATLAATVAEAARRGLRGLEMQARLELESARDGDGSGRRQRLQELARDASRRGFARIARLAAAAAERLGR